MAKVLSGHTVENLEGVELENHRKNFEAYDYGLIRLQPGGWFLPEPYLKYQEDIYNFQTHKDDVFVMTYPKCGTTWTQEIVWTMRNSPDLNHPMAGMPVNFKSPFLDFDMLSESKNMGPRDPNGQMTKTMKKFVPNIDFNKGIFVQLSSAIPDPRTIKVHIPFSFFPKDFLDKVKVVYVLRNPKDVVVSYLHHSRLLKAHSFVGSNDEFIDFFIKGNILYGNYDEHIKEVLEKKGHPNLHLIHFEEMKADPIGEIRRLNKFLGTNLSDEQMGHVAKHTSFAEMKKRDNLLGDPTEMPMYNQDVLKTGGTLFRKGEAGDFKKKLTPEQEKKIDEWTKEKFEGLDIQFKYTAKK